MAKYGLDISKHQGSLNFKSIAKDNSFVILRIGYGVSGTADQKDAKFEEFYKQAKEAGLQVGGYYYSYAKTVTQAKQEAKNCLKYLGGKKLDYPLYYDMEDPGTSGKTSATNIANMVDAFCKEIKAAGYTPGVYASTSWFKNKGVKNCSSEWVRWEANYGKNDGKTIATSLYNKPVAMHQYTSNYKGKYGSTGATKTVDRNIDYSTPIATAVEPKVEVKKEEVKVTEVKQDNLQYATYPMKVMRQSAIWNTSSPHIKCSSGSPKDYPTDLVGADSGRDWCYAPCDMVVLRKYTKASHAIWLRSVNKVHTPSGDKYLYMMSEHQDNAEMGGVGHIYKKGTKMFREGKNGNATGYHLHVCFGIADTKKECGSGWTKNSKGAWVLCIPGVKNVKIEEALFWDSNFTTTIKDSRIGFKKVGTIVNPSQTTENQEIEFVAGKTYTLTANMNVRVNHSTSSSLVKYKNLSDTAKKNCVESKKPYAVYKKGTRVTCYGVYKSGSTIWIKTPKGYWICVKSGNKIYAK